MRYYGKINFGSLDMIRYEGIANQFAYSLPLASSTRTMRTRANVLYLCEGSGSISVTECQSNTELVGLTLQPGTAYVPENLFGNNTVKLESGNTVPIFTVLISHQQQLVDINTVSVNGSFNIPANTYAAIVEGSITINGTAADSNTDLYIIGSMQIERTVEGQGKLITFKIQ